MNKRDTLSRAEYIKKSAFGLVGVLLALRATLTTANAAIVTDNLGDGGGGIHTSSLPPASKSKLWIDTSSAGRGIVKYWDGSEWKATASVWDD